MKYSLTILTPLYNRKEYLPRLYECLSAQNRADIQWLVIDDGSSDRSDTEFSTFAKQADFLIEYYYKPNGGKHTALNFSHPYIKSDWVLILDSDDTLTPDAVDTVTEYISKNELNNKLGIISFQKGTDVNTPRVPFPKEEVLSDHIEFRINAGRDGDCCEVVRTSVLLELPFPEFDGERYMNESHLWIGSADKYKTLYVSKIIYLYEYMDGGLTKSGRSFWRTCPLGGIHSQIVGLNPRCSLKYRIKRAILIHYYGRIAKKKNKEICNESGHKFFVWLFTIPGVILYFLWERKYK